MSVIVRNSYGAIAVNKAVIVRMIIEDMLSMSSVLMLSTKKGKPIKEKPTPIIDPDYYDAVEVSEKKDQVKVKIYIVVKKNKNISETADRIRECRQKQRLQAGSETTGRIRPEDKTKNSRQGCIFPCLLFFSKSLPSSCLSCRPGFSDSLSPLCREGQPGVRRSQSSAQA